MDLKEQIRQQLLEDQKSKGFGDTFEKIMIFTGIKRLVKWFYGEKIVGVIEEKTCGISGSLIKMGRGVKNLAIS